MTGIPRTSFTKNSEMNRLLHHIASSVFIIAPLSAHAQFAKIDDAVKYRQAGFHVLSTHVNRLGAVVKGSMPFDKPAVEANIAVIEVLSKQLWTAFPVGSDTAVPHSKAKPDIWKEMDKFKASTEKMQGDISKLSVAAKAGNLNALKTAFGSMAQTCKSCHDDYRNR